MYNETVDLQKQETVTGDLPQDQELSSNEHLMSVKSDLNCEENSVSSLFSENMRSSKSG